MTHDKVTYWRKRMGDRFVSLAKNIKFSLEESLENARSINLEEEQIIKQMKKFWTQFAKLVDTFEKAKAKRGKK